MKQWKKILAGTLCGCMVLQTGMTNVFAETTQPATEVSEDDIVSELPQTTEQQDTVEQEQESTEVDVKDIKEDAKAQDAQQTLGTVKQLFPDEGFRYLVLAMLNDGCDEPKYTADSAVTQSELDNINQIDVNYVDNKMPATVKSVEGLQYLTNIWCLGLDEQDITDVTTGIDWSKFTKLETIHLEGNLLTKLPDWTKCKALTYVEVNKNLLYEDDDFSKYVPRNTEINAYDQNPESVSLQMNDKFYLDGNGSVSLEAEVNGGRKSTEYADYIYKIDNTEVLSESNRKFMGAFELSEGTHTLSLVVKQYGILIEEVKPQTFSVVQNKSLGSLKTLFPDKSLRKLVINKLSGTSTVNDDTVVSNLDLLKITSLSIKNLDDTDQPITNLKGIGYLKNLNSLMMREQDISDVTDIDWGNLEKLEELDLTGNLLTKIPDLSKCTSLDTVKLAKNKLSKEEIESITSRLPVDFDGSVYYANQCLNGVQEIVEDTYYVSSSGKPLMAFAIEGSRKENYTVKYYVDDTSILSKTTNYDESTIADYVELTEGRHIAYAVLSYSDGTEVTTGKTPFSVVNEPIIAGDKKYVFSTKPNESSFVWEALNLTGKEISKVVVSKGDTVLGQTTSISSYYNATRGLFKKLNINRNDFEAKKVSAQVKMKRYGHTVPAGDYDIVLTMKDGTTEVLKGAVLVTDTPYVSSVSAANGYDDYGDYIYLALYGNNVDPSKLNYEITDGNGNVQPVTYVNCKKTYASTFIVKLKKQNWNVKGYDEYTLKLSAKDGYDVILCENTKKLSLTYGVYLFEYNERKNMYKIGYSGNSNAEEVTCQIVENYNSDTVLASCTAKLNNGIAYFMPKKADGTNYIPQSNSSVYAKFTIGTAQFRRNFYYSTIQNQRENYWINMPTVISKDEGMCMLQFMTGREHTSVNEDDYKFGLYRDGKQVEISWEMKAQLYRTGNNKDAELKTMFVGQLPLTSLEAGQYTLIALYKGEQVATSEFQLYDTDMQSFVLYSKRTPHMSWKDKQIVTLGFATNCHTDADDYQITLTDEDGKVVNGLTYEVKYKNKSNNWVNIYIKGLDYENSDNRYYLKITHKTFGDPVDENGNKFYADERGSLTEIYSLYYGGLRYDSSGGAQAATVSNMEFPVTINVYSPKDTDVFYQKKITEADVVKESSGERYYQFDSAFYNGIPNIDEKYDIGIVDATGAFYMAQNVFFSKENQNQTKELSIKATVSAGTVTVGKNVTVKAEASGGTAPYTYSYLLHNRDTDSWSRLRGFEKEASFTWTAGSTGNREFYVEVKDSTGKVVRSSAVGVKTIKAETPLSIKATVSAGTVTVGKSVSVKAEASGGTAPYTYSYLLHNRDTESWSRLRGFEKEASFTWTAGSTGNREFYVEVKDSTGKVVRSSAVGVKTVKAETPLSIKATVSEGTVTVGKSVTVKAEATGGSAPYTYSYLLHNKDTDSWSRLRGFEKEASFTWTAGSTGNREFYVEVKDSTGKVVRSSAVGVKTVKAETPLSIKATVSEGTVTVGKSVTVKAEATGGSAPYTYSYLLHNKDTDSWSRLRGFEKEASFTWTAGSTGNREFYVEVKDSTGKVVRSSAVGVKTVKAETPLSIKATVSAGTVTVGKSVTVKAEASGGSAPYTYSYLLHNRDTESWSRLRGFEKEASFTWTAGSTGNREFYVEVKDSTGKVVRSSAVGVKTVKAETPLSIKATVSAGTVTVGKSVTVKAEASGGSAPYTYSYLLHNRDTESWSRLRGFEKEASFTWTAGSTGNREFYVEVKDSTGKVVRSSAVSCNVK